MMDERNRQEPSGIAAARAAASGAQTPAAEMEILLRRVERERLARKQAEHLLEQKSRELYDANQQLQAHTAKLELTVLERTRALEEAVVQMEDALRAKGEFLAVVSHEIRTPLNGMLGMAQLMMMTTLSEEQRGYAQTIQNSGEMLLALINDILDYSKMESGKLSLDQRPVSVREVVRDVVQMLDAQAQAKRLSLKTDIADTVLPWLKGDAMRLKQVLINLVGNAVKFTLRGGVKIVVRMQQQDGLWLQCQVRDTGIGIPADRIGKLFQAFSQVDSSVTRRYAGTGLGLVICKRLVEGMGGTIAVESERAQGSTFTFRIPVEPAPPPADAAAKASEAAGPVRQFRVLVVEDNQVNQALALGMLNKLGVPADLARDGEEACNMVRHGAYDVVLMDMQMPRMDGVTATQAIRGMQGIRQPHIVAVTANAMDMDRQACLNAGMNDFLSKPFKVSELQQKLEAAPVAASTGS
jgi:signal transduction histidine kinase/ActR/RegA family two-component response regulator